MVTRRTRRCRVACACGRGGTFVDVIFVEAGGARSVQAEELAMAPKPSEESRRSKSQMGPDQTPKAAQRSESPASSADLERLHGSRAEAAQNAGPAHTRAEQA